MSNDLILLVLPLLKLTVSIRGEQSKFQPQLCYLGLLLQTHSITGLSLEGRFHNSVAIDVVLQSCYTTKELTSESDLSGFKDFRFALFFYDNKKIRKY